MKKVLLPFVFIALLAVPGLLVLHFTRAQNPKHIMTEEMRSDTITLTAPADTRATLFEALSKRSSTREYAATELTLEQLSGVLWAAAGENRRWSEGRGEFTRTVPGDEEKNERSEVNRPGVDGAPGRLTAPSALALYPIRTYAVVAGGIYLYDAPTHTLRLVRKGDFRSLAGLQDFVYTAPLNIMYVADLAVYDERLGGVAETDKLRLCALDAAGYCQNANLWAAANGLGSVTRAGARGEEFLEAIGAPASYRFVLAQTVGVPASAE